MIPRLFLSCLVAAVLAVGLRADDGLTQAQDPWAGCIQTIELQTTRPYFLPTNPRVTLTVRFPEQVLDADGSGFTTDEAKVPGEYRISWRDGDDYLSITPLEGAAMRNLNVHVGGQTVVLVPYPVESPLKALTSLTLVRRQVAAAPAAPAAPAQPQQQQQLVFRAPAPAPLSTSTLPPAVKNDAPDPDAVSRLTELPASPFEPVGPGRLIGMLDRLKLLHAVRPAEMDSVLAAMPQISVTDSGAVFDQGLIRLQLVRVVRDNRLDLVGFIVVVNNVSKREVTIDPESWAARAGLAFFQQATSDCRPTLPGGGSAVAYFVVAGDGNGGRGYLSVENKWSVSVGILSPRINPGASIAESFSMETH